MVGFGTCLVCDFVDCMITFIAAIMTKPQAVALNVADDLDHGLLRRLYVVLVKVFVAVDVDSDGELGLFGFCVFDLLDLVYHHIFLLYISSHDML